ncbi:Possible membrane protein [hydrothermal vent metagenome]|uniref:Possible membrane protein n=1 Tax=hydrothermal vent metagenome TaxID=652676 RepID=A0A1W1BZH9_9ZZZZ
MILTPEVLAILILNSIFLLFSIVAFVLSVKIFIKWDMDSTSQEQYALEKQSYLSTTIIKYIFAIKLPLFLFFVFTLDKISTLLTGAMCGAGVVDATDYGVYLLILKVINLYLFGFWLTLHYLDIKSPHLPYTRLKFEFFMVAFLFLVVEIVLEGVMFGSIDIDKMVSCCGTLYSSSSTSAIAGIFSIDTTLLLMLFYGNFLLMVFFYKMRYQYLFAISNLIFIVVALISLIQFFGTYIYELPTHHCPFCFLQSDYYFVGYLIYSLLFLGTFYGMRVGIVKMLDEDSNRGFKLSMIFNGVYVVLVTAYPIVYFIGNGVWL